MVQRARRCLSLFVRKDLKQNPQQNARPVLQIQSTLTRKRKPNPKKQTHFSEHKPLMSGLDARGLQKPDPLSTPQP